MEKAVMKVMTASEADSYFGLPIGTVKRDCNRKMFEHHSMRKSGSIWLIEKEALMKRYGAYKKRNGNDLC